jgi:hypothetical protein
VSCPESFHEKLRGLCGCNPAVYIYIYIYIYIFKEQTLKMIPKLEGHLLLNAAKNSNK